jgi:hypothetical protein
MDRIVMGLIRFAAPVLLITLCASPLAGQRIESPFRYIETANSVTIFGGYIEIDEGAFDMAPTSAPFFGARYGRRLTGPLSADVGFGLSYTDRTGFLREEQAGPLQPLGSTNLVMMVGEAGLRFSLTGQRTWHGVAPFVAGTIGFVSDLTSGDTFELQVPSDQLFRFGPGFAVAGGVGSEFFLTEGFSLRLDIRDHLWRLAYPGGLSGTGQREDEWTHNFSFTLGGAYHF